ncbi:hypothetical protein D3C73_1507350 [compost metagenome]
MIPFIQILIRAHHHGGGQTFHGQHIVVQLALTHEVITHLAGNVHVGAELNLRNAPLCGWHGLTIHTQQFEAVML